MLSLPIIRKSKKVLKHIGEETQRALPLPSIPADELEDSYDFGEDFPPDEVYFADQEWRLKPQESPCLKSSIFRPTQKKSVKNSRGRPSPQETCQKIKKILPK